MIYGTDSWVMPAFVGYAAVILSFLGGIAWGRALQGAAGREFRIAVVPSLFAWVALLLPAIFGLMLLCIGFALQAWLDWRSLRGEALAWFVRLRLTLSTLVLVALLLMIALPQPALA